MGFSFGSSKSKSSSRAANIKERTPLFQGGFDLIGSYTRNLGNYAPEAIGEGRTLSGGDYDQLEQNILRSRIAPLEDFEVKERERVDQSLADRGLFSSGIAEQAQIDVTDALADNYQQAGADAALQRFGMQAEDMARLDQFDLAANQANWQPLNYLMDLWNGTNSTVSSGKGSGFNIGFSK